MIFKLFIIHVFKLNIKETTFYRRNFANTEIAFVSMALTLTKVAAVQQLIFNTM